MKDFISDPYEKAICEKCDFEYLKSEFCRDCYIDTHVVQQSYSWFENEEFKKFGVYEGINLGEMMDYSLRKILFKALAKIEKELISE